MRTNANPWVSLEAFEIDHKIQPRAYLSRDAVRRYKQVYRANSDGLPPIKLGRLPSGSLVLIDGFHRVEAAKEAGLTSLRAETVETTMGLARWLAVDANISHGVPIPRSQKRDVFKRFVQARQNQRLDGTLMSSREIARKLPLASHATMLAWMKEDFPKIHAAMVGADPDAVAQEGSGDERRRDEAMGNVFWAQKQLTAALTKALNVIPGEDLAEFVRTCLSDFEGAIGRPMTTLEEALDAIHGKARDELSDY